MVSVKVKVACVQMNSGADIDNNLRQVGEMIRDAAAQGAEFITTPENTDFMRENAKLTIDTALEEQGHQGIAFFSALAKELKIHLLIGSMKVKVDKKVANRSFLFNPSGHEVARYDKIHLFDVDLQNGEKYRESDSMQGGDQAVIADTAFGKVGMTICYDVRFPYLYRGLAHKGVRILTIPAAFTAHTGRAHWEVLLRARAIENGCFVIAPAQGGTHEGGRSTYGHSMIIGPWGQVLAERKEDSAGIIIHEINLEDVTGARQAVPSLQHDKEFSIKEF